MITAMVNLFDEGPEMVVQMADELAKMGVKRCVVVEGPYALYPDFHERLYDWGEEMGALNLRLNQHGISMHGETHTVWVGNEVEKRQRALEIALDLPEPWLLIWDVDFVAVKPVDLAAVIPRMEKLFGDFIIREDVGDSTWRNRPFMRAVPGMRYEGNHHTIVFPDGRRISTGLVAKSVESWGQLMPMDILHTRHRRAEARRERQQAYYDKRDTLKAEVP